MTEPNTDAPEPVDTPIVRTVARPYPVESKPGETALGCLMLVGIAVVVVVVIGWLASIGDLSGDGSWSCDDVSYLQDKVYEAGQKNFDEDSMDEYVRYSEYLDEAEADC